MTRPNPKENKEPSGTSDTAKPMDPMAFAQAMAHAWERALPLVENYMRRTGQDLVESGFDPLYVRDAYMEFLKKVAEKPEKFIEIQTEYWGQWMNLWQESAKKFLGEKSQPVIEPDKADRRFRDPEWQENAVFDFIKQSYLLTSEWLEEVVHSASGLDDRKKDKLALSARLLSEALSPTNFLFTNPEVIRETVSTGGENLVRGLQNLVEDLERGKGDLHISTTDYKAFELGENIATTPGRVIYQNDLIQLIQYEPATEKVFQRPLLVIPPWINKYYILDLKPENSFVKWLTEQGHTVFIISWVNPGSKLADKNFTDYMEEGVFAALEQMRAITGEPDANVIGYCIGGTLLAMALAYMTSKGRQKEVACATFLTTLLDFRDSGDLRLFMDKEQLDQIDRDMKQKGVLEARKLQKTFSLLRSSDMIWSFVVNNYLMGREPFPFDLLYWNDDSTNMPAAMHSFYLHEMYGQNLLAKPGGIKINDVPIDLGKIKTPAFFLSTREDHIAPWKATFESAKLLGGPTGFILGMSGHIAGVVNAPMKNKYGYWNGAKPEGNPEDWLKNAKQHGGSWWPHWQEWVKGYSNGEVPARQPDKGLEPAPGSYVKQKSNF